MNKNVTIENRKARHDYFVEEELECGMALRGNEVKSIREGHMSIKEAWINISDGQMVMKQAHITPWKTANKFDCDAIRNIALLAHHREIQKLELAIRIKGYTLVPLKVYFSKSGKCKVLVGLCKGKKDYDKRQSEKEKAIKRDIDSKMKSWNR